MKSPEKARKTKLRRKKTVSPLVYAGGALLAIILLLVAIRIDFNPIGEKIEVMVNSSHVDEGTDPGPFNSNPPTSGTHYPEHYLSEFFNEKADVYPEGYLVHNLEHGYVIFWYNCEILSAEACGELKIQIQSVMDRVDMDKVIAHPWPAIDQPVVMTSWGRLLRFDQFDPELAYRFAKKYHNQAPEPWGD